VDSERFNTALYKIGAIPPLRERFFDISSAIKQPTECAGDPATTGLEPITGLGTPNAGELIRPGYPPCMAIREDEGRSAVSRAALKGVMGWLEAAHFAVA